MSAATATAPKDWAAIANQVMPAPTHEDRTWARDGDTDDIVKAILSAEQWNQDQTAALAQYLKGGNDRETLRNVWFFVRSQIKYLKDAPGHERVKLPAKTWADRTGDCKSMSVFISGLLKNLGIPAKYRFVSFRPGPVTHVYVVAMPKGQRPTIVDSVHDRFDAEAPYHSKQDFPIMTKISVVHGLTDAGTDAQQPRQRTPWQNLNWGKMTEGELSLALIAHQAEMVKNWYGDPTGRMQASIDALRNAMWHGVHRIGSIGNTPALPWATRAINRARMQMRPAGTAYASTRDPRTKGLAPDMVGMPDEEFEKFYKDWLGKGICTPDTAKGEYYQKPLGGYGYRIVGSAIDQLNANKDLTSGQREKLVNACFDQGKVIKIFNEKLPKSSHHVMYNFITNPNDATSTVAAKTKDHKLSKEILGPQISGVSVQNMDLLLRNGIMQTNMDAGKGELGPASPEETIKYMIDGSQEGVGELATLITIISVILTAAAGVAKAMKEGLPPNDQLALNAVQGFSAQNFGPLEDDWNGYTPKYTTGPNGQPQIVNNPTAAQAGMGWVLPVLIGGGLLLAKAGR